MYLRHPYFRGSASISGQYELHAQLVDGRNITGTGSSEAVAEQVFKENLIYYLGGLADFFIALNHGFHLEVVRPYIDAQRFKRIQFMRSSMGYSKTVRGVPLKDFLFAAFNDNLSALADVVGVSHSTIAAWVDEGDRYVVGGDSPITFGIVRETYANITMPAELPVAGYRRGA